MSHITYQQRHTISCMLTQGYNQSRIGETIGKHKSVISREIKRNKDLRNGEYKADLTEKKHRKRQGVKPMNILFTNSIKHGVERLLKEDCSPEQVGGALKKSGLPYVSYERIYQHI